MKRPCCLWFLCALALCACVVEQPAEELQQVCNESDLIAQCPPGSSPLLGSAAESACGGVVGVDLTDQQGAVSGRCLGSAQCVVACQFSAPCPCGVTAVTREGVFCSPCNQAAACGNGLCEGGEDPEQCPEDCGRQCSFGEARCAGDSAQEICDARGRWEQIACPSGEICQAAGAQVVCRRDDVLVGLDPGSDPNPSPERAERFVLYQASMPALGDARAPYDAGALAWSAGFSVPAGGYLADAALAPDGASVWLWRADGAVQYDLTGAELGRVTFAVPVEPRSVSFSADGAVTLLTERDDTFGPRRQIFTLEGGLLRALGDAGAYKMVGGGETAVSADGLIGAALIQNAYMYTPDQRYPNDRRLVSVEYALWVGRPGDGSSWVVPGGIAGATRVSLSPNGRVAAVTRLSHPVNGMTQVDLFDTEARSRVASMLRPDAAFSYGEVLFAPGGERLAVLTSGGVELWDLRVGALLATLPVVGAPVAWSPDGASLLAGSRRFTLEGTALEELPAGEAARVGPVSGLRFGAGGRLLVWRAGVNLEVDVYVPAQ